MKLQLTPAEHAVLRRLATREAVSLANYVRRCLNAVLLEEGDAPIAERRGGPRLFSPALVHRARILSSSGIGTRQIAARLGCSRGVVRRWLARCAA